MATKDEAQITLFSALLEFHRSQEQNGELYQLPPGLPVSDIEKIAAHAQQNSVSPEVFSAALKDLWFVRERSRGLRPSSSDVFGTYLEGIRGHSALEQILNLIRSGPRTIAALATELNFSPEEIVAATVKAEQLGMVRLEKIAGQTTVHLIQSTPE
jgi:hypothetical protein